MSSFRRTTGILAEFRKSLPSRSIRFSDYLRGAFGQSVLDINIGRAKIIRNNPGKKNLTGR
jgi:hypothetical protein